MKSYIDTIDAISTAGGFEWLNFDALSWQVHQNVTTDGLRKGLPLLKYSKKMRNTE